MSSIARWTRRLDACGLTLSVHEGSHAEYEPVPCWTVFVSPNALPAEPIYFPPIGYGRDETLENAIRMAVADQVKKDAALLPEARAYFGRRV